MRKNKILAMLMAIITLLSSPMSVLADEVDVSSGTATAGTNATFTATADVLGGGLTVIIPDRMDLSYSDEDSVFESTAQVIAKGYVEVNKYLDITVPTTITYVLDGFESIIADGVVAFGETDGDYQIETWTQEELKTKDGDTVVGVAKDINIEVPKANVTDIGTYVSVINFNIELKEIPSGNVQALTFSLNDEGTAYTVSSIDESLMDGTRVVIPSEYKGLPVTKIGYTAFESCSSITDVVIPDSVTTIDSSAFNYCKGIKEITIPESVTTIGIRSFGNMSLDVVNYNATAATFNGAVTTSGAFSNSTINELNIGDNVTQIPTCTFYSTDFGFTDLTLNVDIIGAQAFYYSNGLENVILSETVTTIGDKAFAHSEVSNLTIGENVSQIGIGAFADTTLSVVNYNAIIANTGNYAVVDSPFARSKVYELNIDENVTQIPAYLFKNAKFQFTDLVLNVETIGTNAFYGSSGLTNLTLGTKVSNIASKAFYNCSSITSVFYNDIEYTLNAELLIALSSNSVTVGGDAFYKVLVTE